MSGTRLKLKFQNSRFKIQRSLAAVAAFMLLAPLSPLPAFRAQGAAAAAEVKVLMKDYKFTPTSAVPTEGQTIRIEVGTTVTWSNADAESHDVTILEGPELNVSPEIKTGQSWSMTFTRPGRYNYYCEFHPPMVAAIIVAGSPANPEQVSSTFKETGKTVRGKFLSYWNKNGGLAQQGFPISEEMQEKSDTDGKFYTVQYFERAVFELHPENPAPYDVLLSLLGNFEYKRKYPNGAPGQQANTSPGSILFKETGKRVGGKFLDYWNKNGKLAQQGFPISEEFTEKSDLDGKTYRVQYFERAVFEMHPENKPPYDVLLSQLGKFRYDRVVKGVQSQTPPADSAGIRVTGVSSGPQRFPLMSGPHAAPGLNVYIYDQDPAPVISWTTDLGAKWALHQLSWYQIEQQKGVFRWDKVDAAVNALYNAGVNVILQAVHSPPWAWNGGDKVTYPTNAADFGNFVKLAAQRYKGKIAGFQIWNEPNLAIEAGKYVVASRYAELLKVGYTAVKSVDPNLIVISAPLTPTGVNDPMVAVDDVLFLKRLYAYNGGELKGYYDVLGAHPGSNANPPETLAPDNPGPGPGWNSNPSFYFRRIEQLRQVMVDNGEANKQMWLTEFGWASTDKAAPGFEYAEQTTEQEQADYIGRAFRMGRDLYPWMGPMFVFQLNFALPNVTQSATDERVAWGLLRRDGSKRPSYFAFQQYAMEWDKTK